MKHTHIHTQSIKTCDSTCEGSQQQTQNRSSTRSEPALIQYLLPSSFDLPGGRRDKRGTIFLESHGPLCNASLYWTDQRHIREEKCNVSVKVVDTVENVNRRKGLNVSKAKMTDYDQYKTM